MKTLNLLAILFIALLTISCAKDNTSDQIPLSNIEGSWLWSSPSGNDFSSLIISNFENNSSEFALYKKTYNDDSELLTCYGEKGNLNFNESDITFQPILFASVNELNSSETFFDELMWYSKYDKTLSNFEYDYSMSFILYEDELLLKLGSGHAENVDESHFLKFIRTENVDVF